METASDDWLADFNDDGLAEVAVGRLPFRSLEEAFTMSSKILGYEKVNPAQSVALVSDANDGFDFAAALSQLAPLIPDGINVVEVRRGEADPGKVKQRLLDGINDGQKIVNYSGHGSATQWRGGLLTSNDAGEMTNETLPVFVMMTCLNGYFQDPALDSLAESLMRAKSGGAVAVWASSGMTLPIQQAVMNQEFYRLVFSGTAPPRLGEAARRAKWVINDTDVRRTWVLIGDPTMNLR
jgi:hypothetical protein